MTINKNFPVIAGVQVFTDSEGRYNLNALHKASGGEAIKAPAQWVRSKQVKELLEEYKTMQNCIVSKSGRNGGTYAIEELAVAYATWISPKFFRQVINVFIAFKTGQLQPVSPLEKMNDLVVRDRISKAKGTEAGKSLNARKQEKLELAIEAEELLKEFQLMLPLNLKLVIKGR